MTIDERIKYLESEYQHCLQQIQHWAEARLRTEGALVALRQLKEDNEKTNPPAFDVSGDSAGSGGEPVPAGNIL